VHYGARHETLLHFVQEDGKRRLDEEKSLKLISSTEPRRVSNREPASTDDGIHFRVDYRGSKPPKVLQKQAELQHVAAKRNFLQAIMDAQPFDFSLKTNLSGENYNLKTVVDIVEKGVVIDGRGPITPVFFQLGTSDAEGMFFHEELRRENQKHRWEQHPDFSVHPSFLIDGRETASEQLILYRSGDSLVLAPNNLGFFPEMEYVDFFEEVLGMKLPGRLTYDYEGFVNTMLEKETDRISIYCCPDDDFHRVLATRLIVGDAEVRLLPVGDQEYAVTADGTQVAQVTLRYSIFEDSFGPPKRFSQNQVENLQPSEVRAEGFPCCAPEPVLLKLHNPSDEEWAASLADYFTQVAPGMQVTQEPTSVHVQFEPFGIDCTVKRITDKFETTYVFNRVEKPVNTWTQGGPVHARIFEK
ncbi:hypothetical protein ACFL1B_04905, partial [Nanoarchaeota archaeon]